MKSIKLNLAILAIIVAVASAFTTMDPVLKKYNSTQPPTGGAELVAGNYITLPTEDYICNDNDFPTYVCTAEVDGSTVSNITFGRFEAQ